MTDKSPPPRWSFRPMHAGEMNVDPIEGEFFSTEALDSLADALVREAIQNSLDARRPDESLRVRFCFSHPQAELDGTRRDCYLAGLFPHLRAARSGVSDLPSSEERVSFLTIEDFGTRGLQGDPAQSEDEEFDSTRARNDFYFFWRNVGRSRKHASELGRWGLGKTVFPAASRLNAFFALTVRSDDRRELLMGQAVAKIHRIDKQRYYPYGYFAQFEGDFALPVQDDELLRAFRRDFLLARTDDPGLSVVVPYPAAEVTPEALVPSIIHHYFLAIMAGVLTAEVVNGREHILLDAHTLPEHARDLRTRSRDFERLLRLARWSLSVPRKDFVALTAPHENEAPRWSDWPQSPETLAQLRARLDEQSPIALEVPVWVKPSGGESVLSHFEVFLERDDELTRGDDHFIRDYITVAGVRSTLPKGYRCIVAVRDRVLAGLLGDSENPAHTEWQERSPKFKDRYRHGPYTLRYVKNAPRELVRFLTRPAEGRDLGLLRQLFSLELTHAQESKSQGPQRQEETGNGAEAEAGVDAGIVARESFFQLHKQPGGFRISGVDGAGPVPAAIRVEVAYEVRRGNPFAHYQTLDFEFDRRPIEVVTANAAVLQRKENVLIVKPERPEFHIVVTGFHGFRDLRVRVKPIEANAS